MYIKLAFDTKILYCSRVDLNRTKNLKNGKNQKKSEIVKNRRNLDKKNHNFFMKRPRKV